MHTLGDMAKELNRSPVYLHGLQTRFELPICPSAGYTDAYLAFMQRITSLRVLNVPEESLRDLWHLEKKLLQLLHFDSTGSLTWFLDASGPTTNHRRRLLLSNHDMGVVLGSQSVQAGLDFSQRKTPELFGSKEMGEDAMKVLAQYLRQYSKIQAHVIAELPLLRAATRCAIRMQSGSRLSPRI